jgi:ABC-type polysaccharide/polyol phosphate transport system ATPase subunit
MTSNKVNLTDLKIGDMVTIRFHPYSQKYLDELTTKEGTVVEVGTNFFDYMIKNSNDNIVCLFHGAVSYYGDTLGYDYTIYRN